MSNRFNFDRLKNILSSNNYQPPVTIRVNEKNIRSDSIFKKGYLGKKKTSLLLPT